MQVFFIYKKHRNSSHFDGILHGAGVEVQNYSKSNGLMTAIFVGDMGEFSKQFRDYAIASHAHLPPWIVVTNNTKDFQFLAERVMEPTKFRHNYM